MAVTRRREGRSLVAVFTRSWFWLLLFVLSWLTLVTVQIALGMGGGMLVWLGEMDQQINQFVVK